MLSWLKRHSKTLNFFGGIFILLLTVVFYFWTTTSTAVSTTGKVEGKKRFERSYSSPNMIQRKSKKAKDMSVFSKKLKDSKQAENFLLFLMAVGFAMVFYSIYAKYKQKRLS